MKYSRESAVRYFFLCVNHSDFLKKFQQRRLFIILFYVCFGKNGAKNCILCDIIFFSNRDSNYYYYL